MHSGDAAGPGPALMGGKGNEHGPASVPSCSFVLCPPTLGSGGKGGGRRVRGDMKWKVWRPCLNHFMVSREANLTCKNKLNLQFYTVC